MKGFRVICLFIVTIFIFSSLILLTDSAVYGGNKSGITDKLVKIGVIGDLTGPAANVGTESSAATRELFKYVNDQGGIHGRKLKVYIYQYYPRF